MVMAVYRASSPFTSQKMVTIEITELPQLGVHFWMLLKAGRGAPSRISAAVRNCALLSVKCCVLGIASNQLPALGPDVLINLAFSLSVEHTSI